MTTQLRNTSFEEVYNKNHGAIARNVGHIIQFVYNYNDGAIALLVRLCTINIDSVIARWRNCAVGLCCELAV